MTSNVDSFKDYVIDEYKPLAKGYVGAEFKFNYSSKVKIDKRSNVPLVINVVKVAVKLFDKDMNVLVAKAITFENNVLNKTSKKALINIAPGELENKFNLALGEISKIIMNEYVEKLDSVQKQIQRLSQYVGVKGITPAEFKGERVQVAAEGVAPKAKVVYDM